MRTLVSRTSVALGLFLMVIVPTVAAQGTGVPAGGNTAAAVSTNERFFGAVQSIYNPDRAAQAGGRRPVAPALIPPFPWLQEATARILRRRPPFVDHVGHPMLR